MIYVIQTKPKKEDILLCELERAGFTAYVPREQLNIRHLGKWRIEEHIIFPNYVFVEIEEYSAKIHQQIIKMYGYLKFLGEPSPLSVVETEQIKWLFNDGQPIPFSTYRKNEDGTIIFVYGVLKNISHKIIKLCPHQRRAKVSINIHGKEFLIYLPAYKI